MALIQISELKFLSRSLSKKRIVGIDDPMQTKIIFNPASHHRDLIPRIFDPHDIHPHDIHPHDHSLKEKA